MATRILILLTLVCALAWTAQRIRLPAPLLYLPGGMLYGWAASVWTDLPELPFDSGVVFAVFFPALLYAAAFPHSRERNLSRQGRHLSRERREGRASAEAGQQKGRILSGA